MPLDFFGAWLVFFWKSTTLSEKWIKWSHRVSGVDFQTQVDPFQGFRQADELGEKIWNWNVAQKLRFSANKKEYTYIYIYTQKNPEVLFKTQNHIKRCHLDVSENRGTPKSSISIGFSIINHSILGCPYFWKPPSRWWFQRCFIKFGASWGSPWWPRRRSKVIQRLQVLLGKCPVQFQSLQWSTKKCSSL